MFYLNYAEVVPVKRVVPLSVVGVIKSFEFLSDEVNVGVLVVIQLSHVDQELSELVL